MPTLRQYAVLGPLTSGTDSRAVLGCEVVAEVPRRDLPVVVVWLPPEIAADPRRIARLQRETAFVTLLDHPHVLRVLGLECFEQGWARVVSYVDGESLELVLRRARESFRPVDPRFAARIVVDLCDGVHYAHEEGQARYAGRPIVHGGVRPDTVMLSFSGRTMVTGYGASVLAPNDPAHLAYLAPEQIIGGRATASPATDIYALGAILHELLAGRAPFADAAELERAVLTSEPPLVESPGLAGRLGNVAATALAKRGGDRFETAEALKQAILAALADDGAELPGHSELAELVSELIPPASPERRRRAELLEAARDPSTATLLERPTEPPPGVDVENFQSWRAASGIGGATRPGAWGQRGTPRSRPREERTVITAPPTGLSVENPPASEDAAGSEGQPLRAARPREVETVIEEGGAPRTPRAVQPQPLEGEEVTQGRHPSFQGAAVAPAAAPRTGGPRTEDVVEEAVVAATPVVSDLEAPAPRAPSGVRPPPVPPVTGATAPLEDVAPAWSEPVVAPVPGSNPSQPPFPAGVVPPPPGVFVPGMMPPGMMPPGMMPPGMMPPGMMPPGMMPPGAMPPGMAPPGMWPAGQPQGVPPGFAPGFAPPPGYMPPPGMPPPALPPGWAPGQPWPPGVPPPGWTQPPGVVRSSFGGPPPAAPASNVRNAPLSGPRSGPGAAPAPPVPAPADDLLSNVPVQNLPAGSRRPAREESRITQFNRRAGDNSRSILFLILAAAAGLILFQVVAKRDIPPELAEPSAGPALPRELVREALEKAPTQEPEFQPIAAADAGTLDGAAADAPPESAAAKPGTFVFDCQPPVEVFVGNRRLGRTPLSVELPEGRYRFRLTDRETGINLYRSYDVRAGQRAEHREQVRTAGLVVNAPAGAGVWLNGRLLGNAPIAQQTIYEGEHVLQVTMDGAKPWTQRFQAPAGQTVTYNVSNAPPK